MRENMRTVLENIRWDLPKHTRELGFRAPIHDRREDRCVHYDEMRDELSSFKSDDSHDSGTDDVRKHLSMAACDYRLTIWHSPAHVSFL
jgi:hypothetical protein